MPRKVITLALALALALAFGSSPCLQGEVGRVQIKSDPARHSPASGGTSKATQGLRPIQKKQGAEAPCSSRPNGTTFYIAAISASPNSEHFTSFAPSIMRAKS
jgi:hypothetical protein